MTKEEKVALSDILSSFTNWYEDKSIEEAVEALKKALVEHKGSAEKRTEFLVELIKSAGAVSESVGTKAGVACMLSGYLSPVLELCSQRKAFASSVFEFMLSPGCCSFLLKRREKYLRFVANGINAFPDDFCSVFERVVERVVCLRFRQRELTPLALLFQVFEKQKDVFSLYFRRKVFSIVNEFFQGGGLFTTWKEEGRVLYCTVVFPLVSFDANLEFGILTNILIRNTKSRQVLVNALESFVREELLEDPSNHSVLNISDEVLDRMSLQQTENLLKTSLECQTPYPMFRFNINRVKSKLVAKVIGKPQEGYNLVELIRKYEAASAYNVVKKYYKLISTVVKRALDKGSGRFMLTCAILDSDMPVERKSLALRIVLGRNVSGLASYTQQFQTMRFFEQEGVDEDFIDGLFRIVEKL